MESGCNLLGTAILKLDMRLQEFEGEWQRKENTKC